MGAVTPPFYPKKDITLKARRLLGLAAVGGMPVAMGSAPTITTANASSSITGGTTYAFSDTRLRYLGAPELNLTALGGSATPGIKKFQSTRIGALMDVAFDTDAQVLEFSYYDTGQKYRLFVDGQAASLTPGTLGTSSFGTKWAHIDFGSAAQRHIRLQLIDNQPNLISIKVPDNYSIYEQAYDPFRLQICGDSYVDGQFGDGTQSNALGFARQASYRLGVADALISGQSGSGYLKVGTGSLLKFSATIATDVVPYNPDWLIVPLGINDFDQTASAVQTEVTSTYASLLAALPNTIITVVGPWRGPSLNPPQAIFDAVKAGVAAQGAYKSDNSGRIAYVDTFGENWQQIAGKVGATSGAGNSNIYIGADGAHPLQAGHDYLGLRTAEAVLRHAKALAA